MSAKSLELKAVVGVQRASKSGAHNFTGISVENIRCGYAFSSVAADKQADNSFFDTHEAVMARSHHFLHLGDLAGQCLLRALARFPFLQFRETPNDVETSLLLCFCEKRERPAKT